MTNDHSVRSPSTDGGSTLRPCLSESSNTVRAGMREAVARIIDPMAFKSWQGLYDYCLKDGDDAGFAQRCADSTHKKDCDEALAKADAVLAALQLPEAEIQSSDGGVEGHAGTRPTVIACDTGVEKAATVAPEYGADIKLGPSEANSPAAPVDDDRPLPTYGQIPWRQLGRDVVDAQYARRRDYEFDPSFYPGHQTITLNFNSLARIVDKYRYCGKAVSPAPVDAGVREALEIGKELNEILNRYLASHDGDEPHYADVLREWLWDHKARIAAALSSQPVVPEAAE